MKKNDDPWKKFIYFSSIGFEMLAIMLVAGAIGYYIDDYYDHETKWVTLIGLLLGMFISFYTIFRQLKQD
ncbi:MAG: AtpZ/AtpI family protein [Bacteroidales bacterium]|nr:AtpZ/AtpI family protein [Bacteroidales bacterium]